MQTLDRVLALLPDARRNGKGYMARCPAHEDRRPSLSITEGDDGRVLLHCHGGCTVDAVCQALGLTQADLFDPSTASTSTIQQNPTAKKGLRRRGDGQPRQPPGKAFATAADAVRELERKHGPRSALWTYHDATGQPVGVVVRWDRADGTKDIRPVSRFPDGWRVEGMPEPRPLYNVPELTAATVVYLVEGEKAADAARLLGLVATTSPHGAKSAAKADFRPLAGKTVILLPDNDAAGQQYADDVLAELARLSPAPVVKLVELPGLPEQGDIVDFIAANPGVDPGELRERVEALTAAAEPLELAQPEPKPAAAVYRPFPTNALPQPLQGFVTAASRAIGCDPSYVALPALVAVAAAIGNSRCLRIKQGWDAPAILWGAIVGESGTSKTPAFRLVMQPLRRREERAIAKYLKAVDEYKLELAKWKKEFAAWEKNKTTTEDPPEEPKPPEAPRCIVSDTTIEALAVVLSNNPRGVLMARDELAGWLGSFDRYKAKAGGDSAQWLSMYNGDTLQVDRKTGEPRVICVPRAAVSIVGGIQPGILHRALGTQHRESGLAARLLLTFPPRKPKQWTEAEIDPALECELAALFDQLFLLQPEQDEDERPRPMAVSLAPEAKALWTEHYNAHNREQAELTGELSAAWSKLEEYPARLALVVHFVRWAAGDRTLADADTVDAVSMAAGIALTEWFKGEARRVYEALGETDEERDERKLVEFIERKGGRLTARQAQQGCRWLKTAEEAERALNALAKAKRGEWEPTPAGQRGQPTRYFKLYSAGAVYGNAEHPDENGASVDVDGVDADQTAAPDSEWGEV
jgi:hypothetical protein